MPRTRVVSLAVFGCLWIACAAAPAAGPPGIIIDRSPDPARVYIGSPGLAALPDGGYVASHDFFGPGTTNSQTAVFGSADKGKTWKRLALLEGQWWSTLFVHNGALYIMGTSREYGWVVIRRSADGGQTWTEPKDAGAGLLLGDGKYHCAPVPVVVHNGRVWRAMEGAVGPGGLRDFQAFVMSAPADADLLKAGNWTCTNRVGRDRRWLDGTFNTWLEGNAVVAPDGGIVDLLRVDYPGDDEKAAMIRIGPDGKTAAFDPLRGFIAFPGGSKKFTVRFDAVSKLYWSLANDVPLPQRRGKPSGRRNTLALVSSPDLLGWTVRSTVLYHPDMLNHAFQYVDWLFEGADIIAASRTAWDGSHRAHDANYLTFHRIPDFRKRTPQDPPLN